MTDIVRPKTWTDPPFSMPKQLFVSEQIPTLSRRLSDIEQAKEAGVVGCIAEFGMGIHDPEEIRRRCVIVHMLHARVEILQIDGVTRLEWGYLDPSAPHTWTMRTVEQEAR